MYGGNRNKIIGLDILLLIYVIIFQVFILNKLLKFSALISALFILIVLTTTISIIGFRKDKKTDLKMSIFYKTLTLVILFFVISFVLGIFIGFNNNGYARSPIMLLNNIFAPIIIIICTEIYRYIVINSVNEKSKIVTFTTFVLTIFEILISIRFSSLFNLLNLFKVVTTTILPIICKNIVMTSLCRYGGIRSTLLYRLIMDTYIFLIPIVPDFSEYIVSILGVCFPILIYIYTISDLKQEKEVITLKSFKEDFNIHDAVILTCIICLATLLSGFFPLVLIGVGSNSMHPKIDKGDAVIYKKVNNDKDIKVGDVLVFEAGDKVIIHRLIDKKEENGVIYYITQGDQNNAPDNVNTTINEVRGIVSLKIKYIARPTIWFNELINKGS